MGQNGHHMDHAQVVLFVTLLILRHCQIKIADLNIVIFSVREIQQDTYCQPSKSSFFLGFVSMTSFRLLVLTHLVPSYS